MVELWKKNRNMNNIKGIYVFKLIKIYLMEIIGM